MVSNSYLMIANRNIKRNKLRSILLIIGVAFTVALQVGIAVSVDSLSNDFIQGQRNRNYTDLSIFNRNQTSFENMKNLIPTIRTMEGLGKIAPVSTIQIINYTIGSIELPSNTIFYGTTKEHPDFYDFYLLDGKRELDPEDVIISESISRLLLKEEGDELVLSEIPEIGFKGASLEITAIIKDTYYFGNLQDQSLLLFDIDYFQTLFEEPSILIHSIVATVQNLININDIAFELTDLLPDYYVVREKHLDELRATGLKSYKTAMSLLIIASYFIEFLFITNILAITMKERGKELGIMRSIGTSIKQLILLILTEISVIGILGSFIGIFVGLGLSILLLAAFKYYLGFTTLSSLIINPQTLSISIFSGVLVTIISGIWPLFVALKQPIIVNIHNLTRYKKKKRIKIINWFTTTSFGVLLILIGFIVANRISDTNFMGFEIGTTHLLVVALIFIGTLIIQASLITFIPRIVLKILSIHTFTTFLIATKNFQRELQKSTITILTAALSLSFILLVSIVSSGLAQAVPPYYVKSFGHNTDIVIETWDHKEFTTDFTTTLESDFSWIENVSFMQEMRTKFSIGLNIFAFGINPQSYQHFLNEFMIQPVNTSITTLIDNTTYRLIITDILADRLGGVEEGEKLNIEVNVGNDVEFEISGICKGNTFIHNGEYIFLDTRIFQQLWEKTTSKWFLIDLREDINKLDAEDYIHSTYPDLKSVKSTYYYYSMIKNSLGVQGAFIQLIFIHSFLLSGLAQFICILISTLKTEREVAVMRSIGLAKKQVIQLFLTEAGILGFSGLFIGMFNGILGSNLAAWYISQSIPIHVSIESLRDLFVFMLWLFASLVITLASTYIPSRNASQRNIVAALSGRHISEGMIFIYEPPELDIKELSEKLHGAVEKAEEAKVLRNQKYVEKEKEQFSTAIKSYTDEIIALSQSTELTASEKQKWHVWYIEQIEKYEKGELSETKFITSLKRYRKFLLHKRSEF